MSQAIHTEKALNSNDKLIQFLFFSLPFISFVSQFIFALAISNLHNFFQNYTISIVDWIFVIFNYFVANRIIWTNGQRILLLLSFSMISSIMVHGLWSGRIPNDLSLFGESGRFLFSGYVHMIFSTLEFFLVLCFLFNSRISGKRELNILSVSLFTYFFLSLISSIFMWNAIKIDDIIRNILGIIIIILKYIYMQKRLEPYEC